MDEKLIVSPRADSKSTLQLARALASILSPVWGISEAEAFKIALEVFVTLKEEDEKESGSAN